MARHNIFWLCLSLQMQSWIKVWFALVWLQLRLRCVFSVLVFALIGTLTWKSKCRKLSVLVLSTCATLIILAAFFPDRQRNALSMPLSHHVLTTVMHSYTVRLQLTSPVYTAARLIMRSPRSDSATPLLRELHWLPIVCRVDFKLLVFTYKAMHNDAPVYLCELVCPYQPTRTPRSANNNILEVKRTRTKAGDCSFAVAAASLWNNLPTVIKTCDNLTSFKRLLKTHFCCIAY